MTDKQIIIDGVDVSGCVFYGFSNLNNHLCGSKEFSKIDCTYCNNNHNCYYKQLKRKEQECENGIKRIKDLEERIINHSDTIEEYCNKLAKKQQECEKLSFDNFDLKDQLTDLKFKYKTTSEVAKSFEQKLQAERKQLDQLKAENEELKHKIFRYEELLKHTALAQNTYTAEDVKTIASGIKFIGNSLIADENNKLHKTLTEIKEIATLDKTSFRYAGSTLVICDDILLKISEVEDEKEMGNNTSNKTTTVQG